MEHEGDSETDQSQKTWNNHLPPKNPEKTVRELEITGKIVSFKPQHH